jgi:hypothetical protein
MAGVPRHLYAYPLYVYRALVQVLLVDEPTLAAGTALRASLDELRAHYADVQRTAGAFPAEWLRTLPARAREDAAECLAQVADVPLLRAVVRATGDDFALGVARRAAFQAVREQRERRALRRAEADAHLARLAPRRLAEACRARSVPLLHAAVDADARAALALAGAPSAAQWRWLGTLAALLAADARAVRADDVSPAALCLRAAADVEHLMLRAHADALLRFEHGVASEAPPRA